MFPQLLYFLMLSRHLSVQVTSYLNRIVVLKHNIPLETFVIFLVDELSYCDVERAGIVVDRICPRCSHVSAFPGDIKKRREKPTQTFRKNRRVWGPKQTTVKLRRDQYQRKRFTHQFTRCTSWAHQPINRSPPTCSPWCYCSPTRGTMIATSRSDPKCTVFPP